MERVKLMAQQGAIRLLFAQTSVTCVLSMVAFGWVGAMAAYSALLGGGICTLGTGVLAFRMFRHQGARAAKQIVKDFYRGEALKIMLTALLMAGLFNSLTIEPVAFFGSFILAQSTYWFAPRFF